MKVKGILRGSTIELFELLEGIPDGTEIELEIDTPHPLSHPNPAERLARINQLFGAWEDQPDLNDIFAQIDRERYADRGRSTDSFDS